MTHKKILLASGSPRRRQILAELGLSYTVKVPVVDELEIQNRYTGPVEELARELAEQKGRAALELPEAVDSIIISSDTTVVVDDLVLGKPVDEAEAFEILKQLRGRWHLVISGVAVSTLVQDTAFTSSTSCVTRVLMRDYSDEEIRAYIATGDPMDKAGAYAIQHPGFHPVEKIEGCYLNVVGLPLCTLSELLADFDVYPQNPPPYPEDGCWSAHNVLTLPSL